MNKRLKSPLNVQIEMTSECTNLCIHCYNFWRQDRMCDNFSMSQANMEIIMNKLRVAEIFRAIVTGGEPLCNYQTTLSCIRFANSQNIGTGLNSNLVLLTPKRAEQLRDAGLRHILTSMLGPNTETHDRITQQRGSFEKLVQGIKAAQNAGIKVSVNMVVSRLNFDQVRDTAIFVSSLGIKSFMATKAGCPGNCSDFSPISPSHQQLISFLNDLCWVNENLGLEVDTLEPVPLCGLRGVRLPDLFTRRKCNAGTTTMTVSYDGSVRPCSHIDETYGNIIKENLDVIWERMSPWSQFSRTPHECSTCSLLNRCGAGCRMEAKMHSKKNDGLDPFTQLENVEIMHKTITAAQNKTVESTRMERFKTPKLKLRKEDFGGVVMTGTTHAYLDQRGFNVLRQLSNETFYEIKSAKIDWQGLNPEKFIAGLVRRHIVASMS